MDELFWQIGIGLAAVLVVVLAYGALHSVVETKTGFEPFTRRKLKLLSALASLYHSAFYLHGQTDYLDGCRGPFSNSRLSLDSRVWR